MFCIFYNSNTFSCAKDNTEEITGLIFGKACVPKYFYGSHNCKTNVMLYKFKFLMKGIIVNLVGNNIIVIKVWSANGLVNDF